MICRSCILLPEVPGLLVTAYSVGSRLSMLHLVLIQVVVGKPSHQPRVARPCTRLLLLLLLLLVLLLLPQYEV